MTNIERIHYTAKAHTTSGVGLPSRFLVVFLTVFLTQTVNVLAQQPVQTNAQVQGAARARAAETTKTQTETNMNQLNTVQLDNATDTGAAAIRPFRINIPEAALVDLRQRVLATRWPEKETVNDQSQGVQLAKLQALVRYWGTGYDWRKVEAKLNALPQFVTEIDGLDIHFIHVSSRHQNALPLIITHGWPGSVLEIVKAIGPLTDPRHTVDARRTPSM